MKRFSALIISSILTITALAGISLLLFNHLPTGFRALTVATGSMQPAIPQGSLVLMHRVPDSTLKIGDVITYINPKNPRETITHRIIKKQLIDGKIPGFVTKGDANGSPDRPIVAGSALGKIAWHIPYVGQFSDWVKSPIGLALIVYIPALAVLIDELKRLESYFRGQQSYIAPWIEERRRRQRASTVQGKWFFAFKTVLFSVVGVSLFAISTHAAPNTQVALTNNIIATKPATSTGGNTTATNHTTVNISNNVQQTATCGDVTINGNTTTGTPPPTCNASNSSSTSVNVNVTH